MTTLTEADVESAVLAWLDGLGGRVAHGPDIAPDSANAERGDYEQAVLERWLRDALDRLTPGLPALALNDAGCGLSSHRARPGEPATVPAALSIYRSWLALTLGRGMGLHHQRMSSRLPRFARRRAADGFPRARE